MSEDTPDAPVVCTFVVEYGNENELTSTDDTKDAVSPHCRNNNIEKTDEEMWKVRRAIDT